VSPSGKREGARARERTDPELVRAVGDGDLAALGELYDRYARDVWRAVRRTLDRPADAEDIVHAVFVGLPKIAPSYDGRASARAWLIGIGLRLAHRHRRGAGRLVRALVAFAQTLSGGATHDDPESHASDRQELRALEEALAALSPKKREVFALVEIDGLSTDEVARALGIPTATVRTRLHHARRELANAMDEARRRA
jgi:RNA polymerase sigma-70 factor (ECF subfamily)